MGPIKIIDFTVFFCKWDCDSSSPRGRFRKFYMFWKRSSFELSDEFILKMGLLRTVQTNVPEIPLQECDLDLTESWKHLQCSS